MFSRRFVMGACAAAAGMAACGPKGVARSGGRQLQKLGLQTYSLREIFEPDPVGTLRMIKELGFDYVELNGRNFAERSTADLKMMIEDAGLTSPGSHYNLQGIAEDFSGAVKAVKDLGLDYLVVPWIDAAMRNPAGYKRMAKLFNQRGRQAREAGFKLAYHNHQFEFDDLGGGQTGFDILLNETDPNVFDFELDLFWTVLAQQDVVALMQAHPGRFKMCHIKDMQGDPSPFKGSLDFEGIIKAHMVNVGEGNIAFEDFFALNDVSGLEYFVIEHDNPAKPYRASMKQSIDHLRAMRF